MRARSVTAELVCMGLATQDTIVVVPRWPEPDGRLIVDAIVRAGGGPAATAAVAAASLGRTAALVGVVGDDPTGVTVRSDLAAAGVDVDLLAVHGGRTPESVVLVNRADGARTILHAPGGEPGSLPPPALRACLAAEWVHVDHAGWPVLSGVPTEQVPRSRVSVDAGNPMPDLELGGLGLYAPTAEALAARYPGLTLPAAVARALAEGARRVVVTFGAGGALAAELAGTWRVAGASVDVVSTLGAGDIFHGALLAGLIGGRPLPEALRMANLAAALSCRALDGRSAMPTASELDAALPGSPPVQAIELDAADEGLA